MGYSGRIRDAATKFLLAFALLALSATAAGAVPAFAVQTGQPCVACHVGGFGPQLTPFGREFKLHGYTQRSVSFNVPLSVMAQASYVATQQAQPPPPQQYYSTNNNWTIDQINLFVAGGLGDHFGAFIQTTYDGVARAFTWDNLDVRYVTTTTISGANVVAGVSMNNAPTVQDVWNTLPSWGFPYSSSSLAPSPAAGPLIGSLPQTTLGFTGYAWINSQFYLEGGGYFSPSGGLLTHLGADPTDPGLISGVAPYGRVAYQKNYGDKNFEVGAFILAANLYPGADQSALTTDHYTDVGLDGSFQLFAAHNDVFTVNGRYTYEHQTLNASTALGLAANNTNTLEDLRVDASYYWRSKVGLTVQPFYTWGSSNSLLYAGDRTLSPNSSGVMLQLDGTPWGNSNSPLGRRFNTRVGVQYTAYFTFDGASGNYDGMGRSASANNTFRLFAWVAY